MAVEPNTNLVVFDFFNSGEIDVVLLNDTGVQRVEIHDEDDFIP